MHILGGLARWLIVVVIGLATFWPGWGVVWLAYKWLPIYPLPVLIGCLVWAIVLALALPLTVHLFRIVTVAAIALICGSGLYMAYNANQGLVTAVPWWFWAVIVVFVAFGWWKIATPLWRWANGIVAVQQTPQHHSDN